MKRSVNLNYYKITIKLIMTLILLIIYSKISGRSQLSPTTAFDQVGNMIIGAISGTTLLNNDITVINSVIFMAIWVSILLLIRYIKWKNIKFKELIDGKRIQLIKNGTILSNNFTKSKLSIRDIELLIHNEGINGFKEVDNLWFETNGKLSYDLKGDKDLSLLVIEEGKLNEEIFKKTGKSMEWLEKQLSDKKVESIEDVFFAEFLDDSLWIYIYE